MRSAATRVLKQDRVTIPADVRKELDLNHGDYVVIDVTPIDEVSVNG